jgi:hypothetical protein
MSRLKRMIHTEHRLPCTSSTSAFVKSVKETVLKANSFAFWTTTAKPS